MIEPLDSLPLGVFGFEAVDEVEAADPTGTLVPPIEAPAVIAWAATG